MLVAWLLYPLILSGLALGTGLVLERAAGFRLPGPLIAPAGLAGMIVVALPLTRTGATAELVLPVAVALGVTGLALLPQRLQRPAAGRRVDGFALACAAAAFAVFAAPFALTGEATLGGYVELDDTASWLAIADWVIHHGVNVSGLQPSTYEATLDFYLGSGYPVGGLVPPAIGGELLSLDIAWLYHPYLALLAAMLALSLYTVAEHAIEPRPLRALAAFVATQPALLYAYTLWGGFKEPAAAWLVALLAALVAPSLAVRGGGRRALPLAVGGAAILGVLSAGGGLWLLPLGACALVVAIRVVGRTDALRLAAVCSAATLVLSFPTLLEVDFLDSAAASTVTDQERLANLIQPLSVLQVLGIWPSGEFRLRPEQLAQTHVLLAVLGLAGVAGVLYAWRDRRWTLLLYVAAAAGGCLVVVALGSPWVDAKGLATASPAFVLIALAGAAAVLRTGRRVEAFAVLVAVAGGVAWSNVLAYRDVSLAPHARFEELRSIGERIAGAGPTLMTEYEPYGARYFLREADPEGASELRRRVVPLRSGQALAKGESADLDAFDPAAVQAYRTLVLRRSPLASRPPARYERIWSGRYYEVWQRPAAAGAPPLVHLSLGGEGGPAATPPCGQVMSLARRVPPGGRLAAAPAPPPAFVATETPGRPPATGPLLTAAAGAATLFVGLPTGGRYDAWVAGSFQGRLELLVDGLPAATVRREANHDAPFVPLAQLRLSRGPHRMTLRYRGADSRPGSGAPARIGRLVLAAPARVRPVVYADPARARQLCRRSLDWIEVLGT